MQLLCPFGTISWMRASHLRDMHFASCRKSKYKTTRGLTRLTRHPHASNSEAWVQFIVRHYLKDKSVVDHQSFLRTLIIKQNPQMRVSLLNLPLGNRKAARTQNGFTNIAQSFRPEYDHGDSFSTSSFSHASKSSKPSTTNAPTNANLDLSRRKVP